MSQKPTFEKNIQRLQRIVDDLEKGELTLEKSVLLYKEGSALANACRSQLENARLAVAVRDASGLSAFPGPDEEDAL